ncbi:hypothetical protein ACMFMF_008762 [Clarireedia jacksonii]
MVVTAILNKCAAQGGVLALSDAETYKFTKSVTKDLVMQLLNDIVMKMKEERNHFVNLPPTR